MRRTFLFFTAPCLAFAAALLGASREAHADFAIGLDGHLGVRTDDTDDSRFGGGFSGRLGYRFNLYEFEIGPLFITPEVGGGYWTFGSGTHPTRAFAGARLGLGSRFQPAIFGHAGYGYVGKLDAYKKEGFTVDGGASLEFQIVPTLGVGVHVGYVSNRYSEGEAERERAVNWVNFGLQVTVNI
jgi:hypothetical protein